MILVGGLPGTGKTLVGEVLCELGHDRVTVEQIQKMTKLCRGVIKSLDPKAYPYYRPYSHNDTFVPI